MPQGILLDTNAVVDHLRGKIDLSHMAPPNEPLFISLTVLGELYKGVLKSAALEKNRAVLERFLQTVAVLTPDTATELHYAGLASTLEKMGKPIPENDIWIAAVALEYSMPLATRDLHFSHVPGLKLLSWS